MRTDKDVLRKFLPGPGALGPLEPFYAKAEAGRYDLLYGPRLAVGDLCGALWTAGRIDAKGVVLVPTCVPVADPPPWGDARRALASRLPEVRTDLEFQRAFEASLGEPLRGALNRTLAASPHVRELAWMTVRRALAAYAGHASLDDGSATDLVPLLAVLAEAIPIAPLPERGRIWCVLTG